MFLKLKERKDKNIMEIIKLEIPTTMEGLITNTYIVYDSNTKDAMIIDPAYDSKRIIKTIEDNNLDLKYILYTHCHADHIGAIHDLKKEYKDIEIIGSLTESKNINNPQITQQASFGLTIEPIETDIKVSHHDKINLGNIEFQIIFTPGHTSGCMSIYSKENKTVFTGDTLFVRGYGRTDLPTGNIKLMYVSLRKLLRLPDDTRVYPGHGEDGFIKDCR